ncbi:MAG: acetylglutamate kinase, partial [Myxococcota bacterium]
RNLISQLLRNLGGRKEVEQYLKQFSSVESTKFAVIKVGGGVIRDDLESLCSALSFLYKVALYPIVIHGAGPQLNDALAKAGIEPNFVDGMRVTDAEVLRHARKTFTAVNHQLVDALEEMGTRARPIPSGVFEANPLDQGRLGYVGDVSGTDLDPIRSAIRSGHLPILSSLAETPSGQLLNINADVAARVLAERIEPFKVIFLTPTGGILDGDDNLIRSINLAEDYEPLMQQPWLHGGMKLKLEQIHGLLESLPLASSVAMTSPECLPKELFTHRGSGTLIRRGERVLCFEDGLDGVDIPRLRELLEACFDRELVADYFDKKDFFRVYVTESYRATAILTREGKLPYLDKFAVTQKAQGEGLGASLWARLRQDHPKLFWRSRAANKLINPWYFSKAQGSLRDDQWVVFWYGLKGFEEMQDAIGRALRMPASLRSHAVSKGG